MGVWGVVVSLAVFAPAEGTRPKIAVLELQDKGAGKNLTENMTDAVAVALNRLDVFEVISRADILRILQFEQDRQMAGCDADTSCLAELGGALGVGFMVSGSLGKVGAGYIINLTLTDTGSVTVKRREQRTVPSEIGLVQELEAATHFLVRDLLQGQTGDLVLKTSESGADVELDGRVIGTTPLARQRLAGGPHRFRVMKKGFVAWARDVDVKKDEVQVLDAELVPSVEFMEEYGERAGTWRTAAYVTGAVGLVGVVGGVAARAWNGGRVTKYENDIRDAGCRKEVDGLPDGDCSSFVDRKAGLERVGLVSMLSIGVGAAFLGVGSYLYVSGPDPSLYDAYRIGVSPSGVMFQGSW